MIILPVLKSRQELTSYTAGELLAKVTVLAYHGLQSSARWTHQLGGALQLAGIYSMRMRPCILGACCGQMYSNSPFSGAVNSIAISESHGM